MLESTQAPPAPHRELRLVLILGGLLLAAVGGIVYAGWLGIGTRVPTGGPATAASADHAGGKQVSEGGQVTVAVTWAGPSAEPVFTIAMDTHSVNLDGYDLLQLAVLRTDLGVKVPPREWDAPKGGHHRKGTLTFPATTTYGQPVLTATTREVVLVIRDVAGVAERSFRWQP